MEEQAPKPVPKRRWLRLGPSMLFVLATLTASCANGDETPKSVNASDLLKSAQVIGTLGKPLGELTTIRGTWHRVQWKDTSSVFRVSHIDGKPTATKIEFKSNRVTPFEPAGEPGTTKASGTKGISWDWTARSNGKHRPPTADQVTEGESWELLGAERGELVAGLSQEFYDEVGGALVATPAPGFAASFTFIAVRRIATAK